MSEVTVTEIVGLITTSDGQQRQFRIDEEGARTQWGNTTEALGTTVDLLDYLVKSLVDAEYLGTPAAEEDTLEYLDRCSNCGGPDDDGEGYDGYCGNCADRATCEQHLVS